MNEISASEIMHMGNKDQTTLDDNFEQYMIGGQDESHALGYDQEEERKEDSGEYQFSPDGVKCDLMQEPPRVESHRFNEAKVEIAPGMSFEGESNSLNLVSEEAEESTQQQQVEELDLNPADLE